VIQAKGNILHSKIHKHINLIWNKEKLPEHWKEFIIVSTYKKGDKTDDIQWTSMLPATYKFYEIFLKVNSMCRRSYWKLLV
jgi:hypothetical protein